MHSFNTLPLLALTLTTLTTLTSFRVNAWGQEGHQLTGMIAQGFLSEQASKHVAEVLENQYNGELSRAATWADVVKNKMGWTRTWHYINTNDNAPQSCSVKPERDCPDGNCVLGAITNATVQLQCHEGYPTVGKVERSMALKFLIHWFGDMAQPLHACGRQRGGNDARALFDGRETNMHAIWDTSILRKRINDDFEGDMVKYSEHLAHKVLSGTYGDITTLIAPDATTRTIPESTLFLADPVAWVQDANGIDCSLVWPAFDRNPSQDLSGEYYQNAFAVVDEQLAKAGYRMGKFVSMIFDECQGTQVVGLSAAEEATRSSFSKRPSAKNKPQPKQKPLVPEREDNWAAYLPTGKCKWDGATKCAKDGVSPLYATCEKKRWVHHSCEGTNVCHQFNKEESRCGPKDDE
ncbi:hypothetical protein HK102_009031 [Quaeritorhiza haematococci]|nr:hypothetical protein HK102_009031 [Quaeritorhiza haematococci]